MVFNGSEVLDIDPRDAEFRRAVALRALYWLQESISKNGDFYTGGLVPNFTSVAHILGLATIPELRRLVEQHPELNPLIGVN